MRDADSEKSVRSTDFVILSEAKDLGIELESSFTRGPDPSATPQDYGRSARINPNPYDLPQEEAED